VKEFVYFRLSKLLHDTMAEYVLCASSTFCNSFLYTHTVLVIVVGPYTL